MSRYFQKYLNLFPKLQQIFDFIGSWIAQYALPKIQTDLLGRLFVGFSIFLRARKLAVKNRHHFTDLRAN